MWFWNSQNLVCVVETTWDGIKQKKITLQGNSSLRVERRKRGNAQRASSSSHEAEGDRELSSAGVRTRGCRSRILTAPDNFQSWSPSAKWCELYATLHDRFRLEVRTLFYPMRTLKLAAWVTLIIAGIRWCAGRGREYRWRAARGSGAQPRRGVPRRGGAEPPDCHETNFKCFINKFCHEMRHALWR